MRTGEHVPEWRETGVDLYEVLDAVPGRQASNVFLSERADVIYLSSKLSFEQVFGPEYTSYPILSSVSIFASGQSDKSFSLLRVGQSMWLETMGSEEKTGNARCSSNGVSAARPQIGHGRLHRGSLEADAK